MTTPAEYAAATAAVAKLVQADVNDDVPFFFRGSISDAMINKISAKAALDAASAVRMKIKGS
jgi:hypothetical protein